ncbi:MAG: TetR/AcrR family transcriptional regulator [Pseudomonadota bacterium]
MSETKTSLMDAAEKRMRTGGYHAFSFRDLADDLGIKSASVHYHFRQKEDLGVAVVERYSDDFFDTVEALIDSGHAPMRAYAEAYRKSFKEAETGCLCGMLGAETRGLPDRVAEAVAAFMDRNIDWVVDVLPDGLSAEARRQAAVQVVASLQGALMLAVSLQDAWMLDAIVEGLSVD